MYLKASDFALHDLDRDAVFSACQDRTEDENIQSYELELVLKKWYPIERSREMRCFVRDGNLVGKSSVRSAQVALTGTQQSAKGTTTITSS